jgi:glyoxylase-like metal-dependent hydrolase (beta-lactamase superfamily II)
MTEAVIELGRGRMLLDLDFRDTEGLVASYLLPGAEGWMLVETGPTSSLEHLRRGLARAGIAPEEVRQVLVSHIHLDHAGGLGAVARWLPHATMYAHRAGVAHLVDPTRLVASARRAWGASADPIWGAIVPVPPDRLVALEGGERLPLRDGALEVLATPGHARHHLAFLDGPSRALLTGDAAGVRLVGQASARPAVPPPDLDLAALFDSLDRMRAVGPEQLWYTHFGPVAGGAELLAEYRREVERWRDVALRSARERPDVEYIAAALRSAEEVRDRAEPRVPQPRARGELVSSYAMAAQGLLRYFRTHGELPAEGP